MRLQGLSGKFGVITPNMKKNMYYILLDVIHVTLNYIDLVILEKVGPRLTNQSSSHIRRIKLAG